MTSNEFRWVADAVDLHVHTAPDLIGRYQTDLELATEAESRGMKAIVVKSHAFPTIGRVEQANRAIERDVLYGGIALNGTVGGLNPTAAKAALQMGAKIIWLPTVWAANHATQARADGVSTFAGMQVPNQTEQITVSENGGFKHEIRTIIGLAAEYDAVVATGHLSSNEILAVAEECHTNGVTCLINHPFLSLTDLSMSEQQQLVDVGATLEYCYYSIGATEGHSIEDVATAINRFAPSNCVIATDYGQRSNPSIDGLAQFAQDLFQAGLPESTIRTVMSETPTKILNLE